MSAFSPVKVLKNLFTVSPQGGTFRKFLVVTQFVFSVSLIVATIIIYQQINYLKQKNLGFEKDYLLQIPINGQNYQKYTAVKQKLLSHPNISHVTATSHSPTGIYWNGSDWNWPGKDPTVNPLVTYFSVDETFLETFKTEIVQGQFFSQNDIMIAMDNTSANVIINEEFAKIMDIENPVGIKLAQPKDNEYHIVKGVVKNFNFKPLWADIDPIILFYYPPRFRYLFIKIQPVFIPETIKHIQQTYDEFFPQFPFEYTFFKEKYDMIYQSEQRFAKIIGYFTSLAIVISCLGIFGLAFYMAERRIKELGIRKILGASTLGLTLEIVKDFIKLIIYANLIAWPIAWYYMNLLLANYAYRISIGLNVFLLAALISIIIALFTVGYQSLKVAVKNPVQALRYE